MYEIGNASDNFTVGKNGIHFLQDAAPFLSDNSSVIFVTSITAFNPMGSLAMYAVMKTALLGLTKVCDPFPVAGVLGIGIATLICFKDGDYAINLSMFSKFMVKSVLIVWIYIPEIHLFGIWCMKVGNLLEWNPAFWTSIAETNKWFWCPCSSKRLICPNQCLL